MDHGVHAGPRRLSWRQTEWNADLPSVVVARFNEGNSSVVGLILRDSKHCAGFKSAFNPASSEFRGECRTVAFVASILRSPSSKLPFASEKT